MNKIKILENTVREKQKELRKVEKKLLPYRERIERLELYALENHHRWTRKKRDKESHKLTQVNLKLIELEEGIYADAVKNLKEAEIRLAKAKGLYIEEEKEEKVQRGRAFEFDKEIRSLSKKGFSTTEISNTLPLTVGQVDYYKRLKGIVNPKYVKKDPKDFDKEIRELTAKGYSVATIAKKLPLTSWQIQYYRERHEIKRGVKNGVKKIKNI